MGLDEIGELQKEWRAIVLDKLTSVEQSQKEMKSEIVDIKTTFVKQQVLDAMKEASRTDLAELRDKVEKLEKFKIKLIGIAIGAQTVIAILVWVAEHWPK